MQKRQALLMGGSAPYRSGLSLLTFRPILSNALFTDGNLIGARGQQAPKRRIMVVDDEKDISMIFKSGLERKGFSVDVFNDPSTALDHFKAGHYDLLLIDVRMPLMNGFELCLEIRKKEAGAKVFFVSAFEVHEDELRKYLPEEDEKCIVKKPVSMKDLVKLIDGELSDPPS